MKKLVFLALSLLTIISCKEKSDEPAKRILADSSGNINQLSVVMDNSLWEGQVGDALRDNLAAPVEGLPQDEPLFSLSQIPPNTFTGFVRRSRIYLKVEKGNDSLAIVKDQYATPQTGIIITGQSQEQIIERINASSDSIIDVLKATEIKEKQRRIGKSPESDEELEEAFGVSMKFPTAYRYAAQEDDFIWIRKEIPKGLMEILVYEVPLSTIDKDSSVIANIVKMRDSIGEKYIPGPVEGSYMITEEAFAPYLFETKIDGHFAYETRGTWEVNNAYMAGPFVNYAIRDEENDRYLIAEGFIFRPASSKRDHVFELDAILKTLKFNKS
ncbi:DUF4837 family protein [Zunongwangia sp. SCSIO 43204]|uniref:DUF4837 family protein n=1 Tax=Zunongwangia sp. SCSIO 43204 TaxID=2779359 RepID=UPI001CA9CFA9|nr:DUF4837 family protein [Zunongwangia sp. SCSIO 43204]UAB85282.1 DUF4837 family protein [Zunongwangia sp. SCSIO 43204]